MKISVKVGTELTIPLPDGGRIDSDTPSVIKAQNVNDTATLTAIHVGHCSLTLKLGNDFAAKLDVDVVA